MFNFGRGKIKMHRIVLLFLLFLGGCVNAFSNNYEGLSSEEIKSRFPSNNPVRTQLMKGNFASVDNDCRSLIAKGYVLVGKSGFNASELNSDLAVNLGQELTADIVVLYTQYTNTISTMMPLTLPNTTTASTNYYNSYNNYMGSSYSTIYGQSTTYIPTIINRYDYLALYWKKDIRKPRIGIFWFDLTEDQKMQLQTNSGCYVDVIIDKTPAFYANILRGDVIVAVNNVRVIDSEHLGNILDRIPSGQQVNFTLIRNGQIIHKTLVIGK